MKLNCNKNDLYKLISLAERSTSKNPTLPILSSILFRASKNKLSIISTNLEVGFEGNLSARVEEEGDVLPPSKTILSILYSIPDEDISLETSDNNLKIKSKTSTLNIKCFPLEEFPVVPKVKKENYFTIPGEILTGAIKNTISATATTYIKPELASIYIFSQGKPPMTFVATDSFRLAEQKVDVNCPSLSLLLPQKSGVELIRIFEDFGDDVDIIFNKNQILFQSRNISFLSRLTEGKFPDYQAIMPKSFETQVVIDKNQLLGTIRTAGIFSSRLSEVTLCVKPQAGTLEVKSSSSETGEYQSTYPAKVSGSAVEVNFNHRYLEEAIQSVSGSKILLGFCGPQKAVLVKGTDDNSYIHLVMPMRGM